ncbi:hypothetical protein PVAND_012517 [Polypedilum vanderplanki]|uniref:Arrestin-like N-terminal domain-containing protein n=1 Tax=Polypedilum vanderplanki TaxID=319348 RepID=A0A9J6CMZ1_POLVA|nr:hypothetical protein PVAND_012517 [Polypedilum vanderplanki]
MTCDLKINFINDQTMFMPNQTIKGQVTLEITKKVYRYRGLKLGLKGFGICKFKEFDGTSFFAKEIEYSGRERYVSASVNIFKCPRDAPKIFKPDKYTFEF